MNGLKKGMYIESFAQSQSSLQCKYLITFLLRYYNATLQKDKTQPGENGPT